MRRLFVFGLVLGIAACTLFEPSGRRYVVYFEPSSARLMDPAKAIVVGAADWAKRHPDMPVVVAAFADPYGSEKANADFTRLRAQAVIDVLVNNGVAATRIQRLDIGSVKFAVDSHESRRVEITVGSP